MTAARGHPGEPHAFYALPMVDLSQGFACVTCGAAVSHLLVGSLDRTLDDICELLSARTGDAYHPTRLDRELIRRGRLPDPAADPRVCHRRVTAGEPPAGSCESCGHYLMLHPAAGNAVDGCVICLTAVTTQRTRGPAAP